MDSKDPEKKYLNSWFLNSSIAAELLSFFLPPYSKHCFEHGLLHVHVREEYTYVPNSDFNLHARVHSQVPRIRIRIQILSNTNIK